MSELPHLSRRRCPELPGSPSPSAGPSSRGTRDGRGGQAREAAVLLRWPWGPREAGAPAAEDRGQGCGGGRRPWVRSGKWVWGAWGPARPAAVRMSRRAVARSSGAPWRGAGSVGAVRGARFLSAAPRALQPPSGAGMGAGILCPFLSSKLFHTPTRAPAWCTGGSRVSGILAGGRSGWGMGKGQQSGRRACYVTLDKMLYISEPQEDGGAAVWNGDEQAHSVLAQGLLLRNSLPLMSSLSAGSSTPTSWEGSGHFGPEYPAFQGESGSFCSDPAYDLGHFTCPCEPQHLHLGNEGLEFKVSVVSSVVTPAGSSMQARPAKGLGWAQAQQQRSCCDQALGEAVASLPQKAAGP